jgi:hypothetical protein
MTNDPLILVIKRRHTLLANSDWTELPSNQARKSQEWRAAWAAYRQALRDIDPANPVWPTPPAK